MATRQKASVVIVNKTGKNLLSVGMVHKYSNDYVDLKAWKGVLKKNKSTSKKTVRYKTGIWETGRDWWLVTWTDSKGRTYRSNPDNYRSSFDTVDSITNKIASDIDKQIEGKAEETEDGFSYAMVKAYELTNKYIKKKTAKGKTKGFKQHILRAEDTRRTNKIILGKRSIKFDSRSGDSTTRFKKI